MVPTGILSVVALLTNKYDGKGQKGPGSQGQKPLDHCYLGGAVHGVVPELFCDTCSGTMLV